MYSLQESSILQQKPDLQVLCLNVMTILAINACIETDRAADIKQLV